MADKKISQLTTATTPLAGSEVLPIVQSSSTVKVSVDNLTAGKSVSAANFVATGATVPANGMFLGAANTLSFSSNNTEHWTIDSSGNLTPKTTETIGSFITAPVTHIYAKQFTASKTTGTDQIRVTSGDAAGSLASPINLDVTFLGYDNQPRARIRARDATSNTESSFLTFSNRNALSFVDTLQLTTTNDVSVLAGNLVIGTAGKGIDFSANPNAPGMTSELLNDYEEGTWTPTDASGAGLTFTTSNSVYTKIGNLVTISAIITYPATVSAAEAQIGGLPFTAKTSTNAYFPGVTTASLSVVGNLSSSTTTIYVSQPETTNPRTNAQLSAKLFTFSGSYTAA